VATVSDTEPGLLEQLLDEAAQVEHCLLNTYLFAACSLKSLPEEFATLSDGRENRRRAIHFERTRAWKQAVLGVAHEEMVHLHYVQCLLRAIGGRPHFGLPPRSVTDGSWQFTAWKARIGGVPAPEDGTTVPVAGFDRAAIRRFVLYEATDSLQDSDPFSADNVDLFGRLLAFEKDLGYESVLLDVADDGERHRLKGLLADLYANLTPAEPPPLTGALAVESAPEIEVSEVSFQSIADLYKKAILPLYQEAFHDGTVLRNNLDLQAELNDPSYAAEGFLPILPIHRDKNFDHEAKENAQRPITDVRRLTDVIDEIVEEGEGMQGFVKEARQLLATVDERGGARAYLLALNADASSSDPTPDWLARAQRLRLSHLYRFATTMAELDREETLSRAAGDTFRPARTPIPAGVSVELDVLTAELPQQFNAAYLTLVMWLGRMYETGTWESDRRRRMGIEMLASWPLMSLAIRPLLELASFLPIEAGRLFRTEVTALPDIPLNARQLHDLYAAPERSQAINDRLDYYALRTLSDVARWARESLADLPEELPVEPYVRRAVASRLAALGTLDEFEAQFPYREAGGYSDRSPDLQYETQHPGGDAYEEDALQQSLFDQSVVLRLRFGGRQVVQMATDPDPPTDEAGCTGTHMLHAADDPGVFDRSLFWQPESSPGAIVREPRAQLPPLGVDVLAADLCVTGAGPASSGYVPLSQLSSSGAIQTSGVQQVARVDGLLDLAPLDAADLTVSLLAKDGRTPFLNGYNHLVWQDGEPIDPFVFALFDDGRPVWQREIFNEGKTLLDMAPLQRLLSNRGPCGFDPDLGHIPDWVLATWTPEQRALLADAGYPISYLQQRADVLAGELAASLDAGPWTRTTVDTAISFAERLRNVASPRGTTVAWLTILLNYGHTLSGTVTSPTGDVLPPGCDLAGMGLRLAPTGRQTPNGRWFLTYTQGLMDTDALSSLLYGELYVPLVANPGPDPVVLSHDWRFDPGLEATLTLAGTRFDDPVAGSYRVDGNTRTRTLADGSTVTDELTASDGSSYAYTCGGVASVTDWSGRWSVARTDDAVVLTWRTAFVTTDGPAAVGLASDFAQTVAAATAALTARFAPR
jgi:hypothetical protein